VKYPKSCDFEDGPNTKFDKYAEKETGWVVSFCPRISVYIEEGKNGNSQRDLINEIKNIDDYCVNNVRNEEYNKDFTCKIVKFNEVYAVVDNWELIGEGGDVNYYRKAIAVKKTNTDYKYVLFTINYDYWSDINNEDYDLINKKIVKEITDGNISAEDKNNMDVFTELLLTFKFIN
jgi:hypothetical protein